MHKSGLGQDAVIEVMVAILGVMVAVLALTFGLLTVLLAVLGVWGWTTFRDDATKAAEKVAREETQRQFSKDLNKLGIVDVTAALSQQDEAVKPISSEIRQGVHTGRTRSDNELKEGSHDGR